MFTLLRTFFPINVFVTICTQGKQNEITQKYCTCKCSQICTLQFQAGNGNMFFQSFQKQTRVLFNHVLHMTFTPLLQGVGPGTETASLHFRHSASVSPEITEITVLQQH